MKASNIFKIFVRTLMCVFIIAFFVNKINAPKTKENFTEKIKNLRLDNVDSGAAIWSDLDKTKATAFLKTSITKLKELDFEKYESDIKMAKLLIADEKQSSVYLEIEKVENAFENAKALKKNLESTPKSNFKFVRLISKTNPMIVGHVIEENSDAISMRDQDGFIIVVLQKNIEKMEIIDGVEKEKIYSNILPKILDDNGRTSSYGLYLSAKWAYENDLNEKVSSILIEAAMNDSQIFSTISENEARKLLSLAKWSNLVGDYDIARDKAQQIISMYAKTIYLNEAKETLVDILANIEKEKKMRSNLLGKAPVEEAVAKATEKFVDAPAVEAAPVVTNKPVEQIAEPVVEENKPKVNTLALKKHSQEEVNQKALGKIPVNNDNDLPEEKIVDDKKNPALKNNLLYQDKNYNESVRLVNEGKALMKKANSFDNPGNKNAQFNFNAALEKFDEAIRLLRNIEKKFGTNDEFIELAQQANGMHFFIKKTCLRL